MNNMIEENSTKMSNITYNMIIKTIDTELLYDQINVRSSCVLADYETWIYLYLSFIFHFTQQPRHFLHYLVLVNSPFNLFIQNASSR